MEVKAEQVLMGQLVLMAEQVVPAEQVVYSALMIMLVD